MKFSFYCEDIRDLLKKLEEQPNPVECIKITTDIVHICKNIVDMATEAALKSEEQVELNI